MRSFLRGSASMYGVTTGSGWSNSNSASPAAVSPTSQQPQHVSPTAVRSAAAASVSAAAQQASSVASPSIVPLHFASRASYGGYPIYGANMSEAETATRRAEQSVRGRVSKWFDSRGFGFVECEEKGEQYFCHARELIVVEGGNRCLFPGQSVEFEPEHTDNGAHALRVTGPGGAPLQSGGAELQQQQQQQQTSATATAALPSYDASVVESNNNTSAEQKEQKPSALALPHPRLVGSIAHWTYDKGYGFVAVDGQEEHFFTHIKDFTCEKPNQSPSMPTPGLAVEFTPSTAGNKRRATHVTLPGAQPFTPNNAAPQQQQQQAPTVQQQQQQQQPAKRRSNLAMAFAPEQFKSSSSSSPAGTNAGAVPFKPLNSSYQSQQQTPYSTQSGSQHQEQTTQQWKEGYSSGFVDGQQYLQQEIAQLRHMTPERQPYQQQQQQQRSSTPQRQQQQQPQQQQQQQRSSPVRQQRSSTPMRGAIGRNVGAQPQRRGSSPSAAAREEKSQQKSFQKSPQDAWSDAATTSTEKTSTTTTDSPKSPSWSAGWSSATSTSNNSNSDESSATTSEPKTGGGFPPMRGMMRGGFGGRGRRGTGW